MTLTLEPETVPLTVDQDGVVRVGPTRVPLDTVVEAFHEGYSAEEIVEQYSSLEIGDVYAVIAYYLRHRLDVNAYLEGRREQAALVRRDYESRFPPKPGLREKLMSKHR